MNNPPIMQFCHTMQDRGGTAYLAGGAVRDMMLELPVKDWDFVVFGLPEALFIEAITAIADDHKVTKQHNFPVWKFKLNGKDIDCSLPRRDSKKGKLHHEFDVEVDPFMSPEEECARRDFTINSMLYDPLTNTIIDPFRGQQHLILKQLVPVNEKFMEDPLRVYRGLQFAGRFKLWPHVMLQEYCQRIMLADAKAPLFTPDGIWGEVEKFLHKGNYVGPFMRYILLCCPIPMIRQLFYVPQDKIWHPEGTVGDHTCHVMRAAIKIAEREGLQGDARSILLLAALCHDLGKLTCTIQNAEGRFVSPGHAEEGVPLAKHLMSQWGVPHKIQVPVCALVEYHMRHITGDGKISTRMVRRLARDLAQADTNIQMLAYLVEADYSGRPPLPAGIPEQMQQVLDISQTLNCVTEEIPKIITGKTLIAWGLKPGVEFGKLLAQFYELQLDETITCEEDAKMLFEQWRS